LFVSLDNAQYDETGNTYYYVFLTFLGIVLLPSTYAFWTASDDEAMDPEKKKKYLASQAKDSVYYGACLEKAERMNQKNPWVKTRWRIVSVLLIVGWGLMATALYQVSQFDYEMANFDPYEILEVSYDATPKEIKKKYREMSLKYHPDKPTGNEKLFMKLTKAYDALTDETAKYNWEHYGNPDGPQAMQFGIGLPAWIVDEKYSIWVLGVYTLIFMIGLPISVYYWWSNSIKFSGEQVLLDTTQLYYYFFHKTPHMMLKRVLMVLAASLEFERGHNSEIVERPTDNGEIPVLMNTVGRNAMGTNNKEKPLCFGYSVKARTLLFAHLSRIALPPNTLHQDRLYIIKKCPFLIQEMVTCISQLILLAHAGRIGRLPSLDTIEYAMKLSPLIVQALWEKSSPLLQLPHIEEDMLKHFFSRKRNIKTPQQLAKMKVINSLLILTFSVMSQI
jgi:translocation protein SEC63